MTAAIIALFVGLFAYGTYYFLFVGKYASAGSEHTKHALDQIYEENSSLDSAALKLDETLEILKADINDSGALKFISMLPMGSKMVIALVKGGMQHKAGTYLAFVIIAMLLGIMWIAQSDAHPAFYLLAIIVPLFLARKHILGRIRKRNDAFVDMFPDVLDMIVRSVRSGFPVNSAITMVAENMEDPVRAEFKQVADELTFGRPITETLERLATRIDEPDVRFFVVVLKVQQDTGGNLAEVIENLSGIIRKRKQLRRKIRAMTSEGRITGYILGGIPILLAGAISVSSPGHMEPFFESTMGNIMFGVAIGLVILSQIIVRKMIQIDI